MHLPGRLDSTTLGDLLGTLYRGNATGVLELSEIAAANGATRHGRTHRIHLLSGLVASVETELQVTPIGEVLCRSGKVDPRAIDVMLYRVALGDPRPAGAILVGMGAVAEDAVVAALRAQLHAKVDAVYRYLADARVTFRTSRPLPRDVLRVGTLMPRDFLHGRQRCRDRRAKGPDVQGWPPIPQSPPRAPQSPPPPHSTRAPQSPPPPHSTRAPQSPPPPHSTRAPQSSHTPQTPRTPQNPPPPRRPSWTTNAWFAQDSAPHAPQETPPPASGHRARERASAPPRFVPITPRGQALRTLGLPDDADETTVRRAFKRLAMELHPDRFATSPEDIRAKNAALFAEASAAFHLLVA